MLDYTGETLLSIKALRISIKAPRNVSRGPKPISIHHLIRHTELQSCQCESGIPMVMSNLQSPVRKSLMPFLHPGKKTNSENSVHSRRTPSPHLCTTVKMVQNKALIYASVPNGWPIPGENLKIQDISFDESAPPPKNGFTTKNFFVAYDPSQRGRMRDPSIVSYSPAMKTGEPVISVSVIGKVLKSDNEKIKEGSIVMLLSSGTEEYSAKGEDAIKTTQVIEMKDGVPLTAYLGLLGMTGMTAYGSLHEIGQPTKGDVILISAAAGAVGQMVGQIAVREGLHVCIIDTCPATGRLTKHR